MSKERDFKENIRNLKVKVEESKLTNEYSKKALGSLLKSLEEVINSDFDNEAVPKPKIEKLETNVKDLLKEKKQFDNPDLEKSLESLLQSLTALAPSEDETKVTQQREKLLETVKTFVEYITYMLIERLLYHVTNQPENRNDVTFNELKAFKIKYGGSKYHPNLPIIEGDLVSRMGTMNMNTDGKREFPKCAFLSSTFYNNKLPDRTPYPTDGEIGTKYKRFIINFDTVIVNYPICWFWCAIDGQVHYICGKECDEEKIEKSILEGYTEYEKNKKKDKNGDMILNENVKKKEDYIKKNEKIPLSESEDIPNGNYKIIYKSKTDYVLPRIQNNYDKKSDPVYKVFYNIAVCGDIPLKRNTKNNPPSKNGDYNIDFVVKSK